MTEILHIDSSSTPQIITDWALQVIEEMPQDTFDLNRSCPEIFVDEVYEEVVERVPTYLSHPRFEDVVDALIDNEYIFEED